ncbi:putative Septin and tuftelin-interacting protein 1-like protein 1 [Nannochloris sp. 'desiccata']|nr:putative Septin and tuftelin-interacting protein 1-like protein 1 [Chlorella desiccata (nom. nud.)]
MDEYQARTHLKLQTSSCSLRIFVSSSFTALPTDCFFLQDNDRFDVENDYEGGEWVEDEFFYRNKRKKRSQTRDDQIYGVFAGEDDSDSDGVGVGKRRRRGGGLKTQDYAKPVGFVGGGVMGNTASAVDGEEDEETEQEAAAREIAEMEAAEEDDEEEDAYGYSTRGGLGGMGSGAGGLGFCSGVGGGVGLGSSRSVAGLGAGGLGFRPAAATAKEEEEEFLPTAFGRRIKAAAEERRNKEASDAKAAKPNDNNNQLGGTRGGRGGIGRSNGSSRGTTTTAGDIGSFEVHTKGIGSKLLSQMGWKEGHGLGRDGKGIAKPLEAKLRPKGMGMGFGDRREPKLAPEETKVEKKEEQKELKKRQQDRKGGGGAIDKKANFRVEGGLWRKKMAEGRVKRTFRTADELLLDEEEGDDGFRPVKPSTISNKPTTVIVDMRGPQTRVLTNLENLNVTDIGDEDDVDAVMGEDGVTKAGVIPMPELRHNMKLLVELAETDIQLLDGKLRQGKDTQLILEREKNRLEIEAKEAVDAMTRVQAVLEAVEAVQRSETLNIEQAFATFSSLKTTYPVEYQLYKISAAALGCVLPLFIGKTQGGWSPLAESEAIVLQISQWKPLLEEENHRRHSNSHSALLPSADVLSLAASSDPYLRLICEILLPPLRRDLVGTWDPRDATVLEKFIDVWEKVLPLPAFNYIMQHLVLPKLKTAVDAWDPTSDPIALHTWIHPWLPWLGSQLSELWPTVRFKFKTALEQWHPADESARMLLAPWKSVFGEREWEALLCRAVIPKLEDAMVEFQVNPAAQDLEPFLWVMDWAELMPRNQMSKLLIARFFPKWHAALRHWLSSTTTSTLELNLDDVTRWYLQWKALFPERVLESKTIKAAMNAALDAINTAGQGLPLPTTWTAPPSIPTSLGTGTGTAKTKEELQHPSYEHAYGHTNHHTKEAYEQQEHQAPASFLEERPLKALVEDFAVDSGIDFLPKPGRVYEGLQVYGFGLVSCAVDSARQRLWAQMGGERGKDWVAASMGQLLDQHKKREAAARGKK